MTTRKSEATGSKPSNRTRTSPSTKGDATSRKSSGKAGAAKRKTEARTRPKAKANAKAKTKDASAVWTLRLYITGRGERSERALRNLRNLCEANMKEGTYKIEVIDLLKNPALAKTDQILAIPTLVRKLPEPMKRIIGDLSDADRALVSLDLVKQP
jgi:circadian clock protein KaiB